MYNSCCSCNATGHLDIQLSWDNSHSMHLRHLYLPQYQHYAVTSAQLLHSPNFPQSVYSLLPRQYF